MTKTIEKYLELKEKLGNYISAENGFFFAFNNEQFEEGQRKINNAGWFNKGEKLIRINGIGGVFTTKRAYEKWKEYSSEIEKQIKKECNPQEVYEYEWDNYETEYNCYGDADAMLAVLSYFGEESLKSIKRKIAMYTIEQIIKNEIR